MRKIGLLQHLARWYLFQSWKRSLDHGDRVRLNYWGATGKKEHHPYIWADFPTLHEMKKKKQEQRSTASVKAPIIRSFSLPNGSKITSLRESTLQAGLKAASLALREERQVVNYPTRDHTGANK